MWTVTYKGYYIQGYCDKPECTVLYSPSGYGYDWKKECRNLHAAKLAITKRIKQINEANK